MVDFLIVLGVAVAILATAYVLTMLFWQPERNVERAMLGHWFRSLIRLYEPESLVRISHRGSSHEFTLRRRAGQGSQCWVVLTCPHSPRAMSRLAPLRDWIETEPRLLVFRDSVGPASSRRGARPEASRPEEKNDRLEVQVSIPDIWSSDAADIVLGIAQWQSRRRGNRPEKK